MKMTLGFTRNFSLSIFSGGKRLSGHDWGIPVMVPLPETNKLRPDNWSVGIRWSLPFWGPKKRLLFSFFAASFQWGVNKLPFWLKWFCCSPGLKDLNKLFFVAFRNECFPKIVEDVVCATRFLWPCSFGSPLLFSYIQYTPSNRLQTSDSYSPTTLTFPKT